jgi:hypothetical protein
MTGYPLFSLSLNSIFSQPFISKEDISIIDLQAFELRKKSQTKFYPSLYIPKTYNSPFHSISKVEASNAEIFSRRAKSTYETMLLNCKTNGKRS